MWRAVGRSLRRSSAHTSVALFQIKGKDDDYRILDEYIQKEDYAVGFKLGNEELRDKVQEAFKRNGEGGLYFRAVG